MRGIVRVSGVRIANRTVDPLWIESNTNSEPGRSITMLCGGTLLMATLCDMWRSKGGGGDDTRAANVCVAEAAGSSTTPSGPAAAARVQSVCLGPDP